MSRPSRIVALGIALTFAPALAPAPVDAAELRGKIRMVDKKGRTSDESVVAAVAYFVPAAETTPAPPEQHDIVTVRKDFLPHVLPVPTGSTVRFPNEDPILHNVFSVSGGNRFDLGLYRKGDEGKEHTFESSGVVQIFCNVHHDMAAYVLVLDTPFYTVPQRDGSFLLEGLPDGPGTLHVWHERSEARALELDLPVDEPIDLKLVMTRSRIPKHQNKFGKPYPRRSRERY